MKTKNNKFAFLISALTSPYLIIPFFSLLTIYHYSTSTRDFLILGSIFLGFSVLSPFLYIILSLRQGRISDIHVAIKEQRLIPFILAIIGSVLVLIFFNLIRAPRPLAAMSWALFANGVVFAYFTHYWKVSIHSASFASSITIVGILVNPAWFWLYPLIGLIFWARLARKKHSLLQLLFATVVSPVITALVLFALG